MSYKMFLDDVRTVDFIYPKDSDQWILCRSYDEAVVYVQNHGFPNKVSFDHDLGIDSLSGYDFAKYLVDIDLNDHVMPAEFSYHVHSANPVGAANIIGLLDGYLNHRHLSSREPNQP